MRQRHTSQFLNTDQDRSHEHPNMGQSYVHMGADGRSIAPECGSFPHPMDNIHGFNHAFHHNLESISIQHSTNFTLETAQGHSSISGPSHGIFPHFPAGGSTYPAAFNPSHDHSSQYNRHISNEVVGGLSDHTLGTTRDTFKRKRHCSSVSLERGSRSSTHGAGSSSSTFEHQLEKMTPDYRNYSSGSTSLPPRIGGSLSVSGEGSTGNVRIGSRLDLEPNSSINHSSRPLSGAYYSNSYLHNHPVPFDAANINAGATSHRLNYNGVSPPHRRFQSSANGSLSHETNHYYLGGSLADTGRHHHELSRNHAVAPHLYGFPAQDNRERQVHYSQRAIPSQRANLTSFVSEQEVAASANSQWTLSDACPTRYPRSHSSGGWRGGHREGRPGIAIGRFRSLSSGMDAHDRVGSEGVMVLDHSYLYGSRNLHDQYMDMRLDVDSMSYEELLAVGDRIGNVNTGLSEDAVLKCLIVTPPSAINLEDSSCAICLEEYNNMDKVGALKNCKHDYHVDCIKKWLSMKNACPICKAPAVADS